MAVGATPRGYGQLWSAVSVLVSGNRKDCTHMADGLERILEHRHCKRAAGNRRRGRPKRASSQFGNLWWAYFDDRQNRFRDVAGNSLDHRLCGSQKRRLYVFERVYHLKAAIVLLCAHVFGVHGIASSDVRCCQNRPIPIR